MVSGHEPRRQFFADLDRLRVEAGGPAVQIIARATGLRETTIRGWFPAEPTEHRILPRNAEQLITLVTYFLRRSNRLAPKAPLDRRTSEDWLRRRHAAASSVSTPQERPKTDPAYGGNNARVEHDPGVIVGWGGIAAVLNTNTDLPSISEVDGYRLGATPTRFGSVGHSGDLDPYVLRSADDIDDRITEALHGSTMVLVIGWSMVGKTRTLFEAVRRGLPEAKVLVPERTALHAIPIHPAYRQSSDTIVVWLDDLDEYLQTDQKLTPTWLTHMIAAHPGRTVVVATMRREAFERLENGKGEPTKDIRALLNQAVQFRLESTSDSSIEHAAAEKNYPDLGLEQYRALGYGLGEVLAGAPALLARYDRADTRLRAVIEVAIDWRRVGRPDPIPEEILIELANLRARTLRPSLGLDATAIAETILTAREPVEATAHIAALHTLWSNETDCGYRAFDYLVAADDGQHGGRQRPIPDSFWDKASEEDDHYIVLLVAFGAYSRGFVQHALRISQRAADTGRPEAMFAFGLLLAELGDFDKAETWYRHAADNGDTNAMNNLGYLLKERGELDEAETWWGRAADDGNANAMNNLGLILSDRGELDEAETWYRHAADNGNTAAMTNLGRLLKNRGDVDEAETWYRRSADTGDTAAMNNLGRLLKNRGDVDEAETWFRRSADTGNTNAMNNLGLLLEDRGELDEAETWYRRAADDGNTNAMTVLGLILTNRGELDEAETWHRRAADNGNGNELAMAHLGDVLKVRGELDEAETWWGRATDNGSVATMLGLGLFLTNHGDIGEAEAWYRRAADTGDANAMASLGLFLTNREELDEAETWHRRAADAGNTTAMDILGLILKDRGELDEAETWYRRAADNGNTNAMTNLGLILSDRGELDEAETCYRHAANNGNTTARFNLGLLLEDRGELDEAETCYRRAADNGDTNAMNNLGLLLEDRGELDEAETWYRRAADDGDTNAMNNLAFLLQNHGDSDPQTLAQQPSE